MSDPGSSGQRVRCPNCGEEIDVNALLYHQLDSELRQQYQAQLADQRRQFEAREAELEKQRVALAKDRSEQARLVESRVADTLKRERESLTADLRKRAAEEQEERVRLLQAELEEKSKTLKAYHRVRSEVERLKREKDELADSLKAEAEAQFSKLLGEQKLRIRKEEADRVQLNLAERDKLIEQLRTELRDTQRRAEQGATQLRGEVQELAIEDWLQQHYPLDIIEEVKKGARGADCLQIVNTRQRQRCGTIYYESKRAKTFQPAWIGKFRADIREKRADVGVLVTEAMPPDMPRMGLKGGIWVCTVDEFKGLSAVLRDSIVRYSAVAAAQHNKGDKMELLYDYLTGDGFRHQIEAIVDGFTQLQRDLETEKRSMQAIWRKREMQIRKVLESTTGMYGDVKGIAGTAIQSVPLLELPAGDGVDEDKDKDEDD